ncbi:MarR family winged helix-turn-helix transcriptional regulator [Pseudonocardia sp. H11422]|uniref:MarR family winged helix-turn-helix transcriptional regulator n=1 Tax=Pseudonocardia sp. H11422 TaxID=2835866 RepID=UPI001BDC3C35|nr:MarR family transcriptional regulator [Pseudonocardia sp. H11422]
MNAGTDDGVPASAPEAEGRERDALLAAIESHEVVLRRSLTKLGPNPVLDSGLTMQQLRVLLLLSTDGPLTQGDLAQGLHVGLATVTGLIDRLVARGLVERTEDPRDRRIRLARLAPGGVDLIDRIASAGQEARRRLLTLIDLSALRGLEHGLAALRAALERESP